MENSIESLTDHSGQLELDVADISDRKNVDDFSEEESSDTNAFSISSYGADYTIDSLVSRMKKGDFFVPDFQRAFVWNFKQASRFIESLLMGLPVPGIFVFRENETNKHLIIDGQQRLKSIVYFYSGHFKKTDEIFRLTDVREPWIGRTYEELDEADRRRLDDSILHTTIFRQDAPENNQSVYEVFERINTGGIKLSPQEIRVCVNFGPLTDLLIKLNDIPRWREIYGPRSLRLKDQELVLRFFAFYERVDQYSRPLRSFLNSYMTKMKNLDAASEEMLTARFAKMVDAIHTSIGKNAFRPERAINTAVFDAVSVALLKRLEDNSRPNPTPETIKQAYEVLLSNSEFKNRYTRATADEENVRERFRLATSAFQGI